MLKLNCSEQADLRWGEKMLTGNLMFLVSDWEQPRESYLTLVGSNCGKFLSNWSLNTTHKQVYLVFIDSEVKMN